MSNRQAALVWVFAGISSIVASILRCSLTEDWSDFIGCIFVFTIAMAFFGGLLVLVIRYVGFTITIGFALLTCLFLCWRFDSIRTFEWYERVGAVAADGWVSSATGQGAASHHGGVARWLTQHHSQPMNPSERYYSFFGDYSICILVVAALPTAIIYRIIEMRSGEA